MAIKFYNQHYAGNNGVKELVENDGKITEQA